ncbi:receptor-type tyrosine-protein phosphatase H isoform X3 [Saimiri boliviensis]|uniref:receptor-type tyrosine-protein phosphatase H isoform X3 n=1 Tax=Saimiri boliviensis TaxID=27679 RepID=UPI003D786651
MTCAHITVCLHQLVPAVWKNWQHKGIEMPTACFLCFLYLCSHWISLPNFSAPNPVRNLTVEAQTTSSITLRWEVPEGPHPQNSTYWVECTGDGGRTENRNTTDTNVTVDGLEPGSLYTFSVWVEKNGVNSSEETVTNATAPNPVRNLTVEAQTTSSITLRWEVPEGPHPQNSTYWVECTGDGGRTENRNTTDTNVTVDGLEPGSLYTFSVWVEKYGVNSSEETVTNATAPNPVRNLTVEAQTTSSITLRWEVPEGPHPQNSTYWVECTGDGGRTENRNTTDTNVTVDGLEPGSLYTFSVWVEKNGVNSSEETVTTATAPNPVGSLTVEAQTTSSITLRWEVPEGPHPQNSTYWVECTGDGGRTENRNTTDTNVTVDGLEPGSLYTFSVWVEKNGVNSSEETVTTATAPNPVRNLTVEAQTTSSITLRWEVPEGPHPQNSTYWVECTGDGGRTENRNTTDTNVTVDGLEPGSLYTFSVWVEKYGVNSSEETVTNATVPNAVRSLSMQDWTNSSIALRWTAPQGPGQSSYTYWVSCVGEGITDPRTQSTSGTEITLKELEAGSLYNLTVWAERNEISGYKSTLSAATAPSEVTDLQNKNQTDNSVTLWWQAPRDPHSQLYVYRVQWASEGHPQREQDPQANWANQSSRTNETWYKVEALEPGTLYNFTVWAERNDMASSTQSIRVSTNPDTVTITSCVSTSGGYGVILTWSCPQGGYEAFELEVGGQRGSQDRASCGKGVSVLGLGPAQSYPATITTIWDGMRATSASVTCHTESAGIRRTSRNQNSVIWSSASQGTSWLKTLLTTSRRMRRTATVVLQWSTSNCPWWAPASLRWWLQLQRTTPRTATEMCCPVKCEHYWPLDSQPCTHGHLQVTLESEEVTENWTVRELQLLQVKEQKMLSVRQFHYLAWPDHGVPSSPDTLLAFWRMLRQWLDQTMDGGPPIVHCSAGVGRTGTLIALDVLLRQLECEGLLGPFSFVKKMRESRPLMVQTEAQYVFLHQCILQFLQQSAQAPAEKEAIYENVENLIYENAAAILAHQLEV